MFQKHLYTNTQLARPKVYKCHHLKLINWAPHHGHCKPQSKTKQIRDTCFRDTFTPGQIAQALRSSAGVHICGVSRMWTYNGSFRWYIQIQPVGNVLDPWWNVPTFFVQCKSWLSLIWCTLQLLSKVFRVCFRVNSQDFNVLIPYVNSIVPLVPWVLVILLDFIKGPLVSAQWFTFLDFIKVPLVSAQWFTFEVFCCCSGSMH